MAFYSGKHIPLACAFFCTVICRVRWFDNSTDLFPCSPWNSLSPPRVKWCFAGDIRLHEARHWSSFGISRLLTCREPTATLPRPLNGSQRGRTWLALPDPPEGYALFIPFRNSRNYLVCNLDCHNPSFRDLPILDRLPSPFL